MASVQPSFDEISTKMDDWLERETEIERDLVGLGEEHDHKRFDAFAEMATCQKTCVGGGCSDDQSKILCGLDSVRQSNCVVYSIGSNNMWDFERSILKLNPGCEVHSFDCTGHKSRFKVPEGIHFHHVCLGPKNKPAPLNPGPERWSVRGETWTLEKMQSTLNHTRIDLLKMDIEGYEWPLLNSWPELFDIRSQDAVLPMQIAVEVHYQSQMEELAVKDDIDFKHTTDHVRLQSHLLKMGYAVVVNDRNPACPHCTELTLMRIRCPIDHQTMVKSSL
jgi:hypothetical protein